MEKKEIVAHAITHAPKGVKGGPYEGPCGIGKAVPSLAEAWRNERAIVREAWRNERAIVRRWLRAVRKRVPTARVIRIVRKARPSVTAREAIAHAITHAPRGQKGGPYWAERGGRTSDIRLAMRFSPEGIEAATNAANHADARVIRIVRARPSAEPTPQPSEASAVEVLRELVAWSDNEDADTDDVIRIATKARRVLAAAGPDPSEVVRAALSWSEATAANGTARTVALQLACVAYRKAGGK